MQQVVNIDPIYEKLLGLPNDQYAMGFKKLASSINMVSKGPELVLRAVKFDNQPLLKMLLKHSRGLLSSRSKGGNDWATPSIQEALVTSVKYGQFECFKLLMEYYMDIFDYSLDDDSLDSEADDVDYMLAQLLDVALDYSAPRFHYWIAHRMVNLPLKLLWKAAEVDSYAVFYGSPVLELLSQVEQDEIIQAAIDHDSFHVLDAVLGTSLGKIKPGVLLLCARGKAVGCLDMVFRRNITKEICFECSELESAFMAALLSRNPAMLTSFLEYFDRHGVIEKFIHYYEPISKLIFSFIIAKMNIPAFKVFGKHLSRFLSPRIVEKSLKIKKDHPEFKSLVKHLPIFELDSLKMIHDLFEDDKITKNHPLYHLISLYSNFQIANIKRISQHFDECCLDFEEHRRLKIYCPAYGMYVPLIKAINRLDFPLIAKILNHRFWRRRKIPAAQGVISLIAPWHVIWIYLARCYIENGYMSRKELYNLLAS